MESKKDKFLAMLFGRKHKPCSGAVSSNHGSITSFGSSPGFEGRQAVNGAQLSTKVEETTRRDHDGAIIFRREGSSKRRSCQEKTRTRRSFSPSMLLHKTARDIERSTDNIVFYNQDTAASNDLHNREFCVQRQQNISTTAEMTTIRPNYCGMRNLSESPRRIPHRQQQNLHWSERLADVTTCVPTPSRYRDDPLGGFQGEVTEQDEWTRMGVQLFLDIDDTIIKPRKESLVGDLTAFSSAHVSPQNSHDSGFDQLQANATTTISNHVTPDHVVQHHVTDQVVYRTPRAAIVRFKSSSAYSLNDGSMRNRQAISVQPEVVGSRAVAQSHWSLSCSSSEEDDDDQYKRVVRKTRSQLDRIRRRSMDCSAINNLQIMMNNALPICGRGLIGDENDDSSASDVLSLDFSRPPPLPPRRHMTQDSGRLERDFTVPVLSSRHRPNCNDIRPERGSGSPKKASCRLSDRCYFESSGNRDCCAGRTVQENWMAGESYNCSRGAENNIQGHPWGSGEGWLAQQESTRARLRFSRSVISVHRLTPERAAATSTTAAVGRLITSSSQPRMTSSSQRQVTSTSRLQSSSSTVLCAEALRYAARCGHVTVVRELLDKGFSSADRDEDGCTALHYAAGSGRLEVVQMLLDGGCPTEIKDKSSQTALHRAAAAGHADVVRALLDAGCSVNRQDADGNSALHKAAWNGFSATAQHLLAHSASTSIRNKAGCSALHLVAQNGHNQCARVLLFAGCPPNTKNEFGDTALHTAARYGHAGVALILVNARCQLSLRNKNGDTALHIVVALRRKKIAQILIDAGINCNIRNKQGEKAADIALCKKYEEILELIKEQTSSRKKRQAANEDVRCNADTPIVPLNTIQSSSGSLTIPATKEVGGGKKKNRLAMFFSRKKTKTIEEQKPANNDFSSPTKRQKTKVQNNHQVSSVTNLQRHTSSVKNTTSNTHRCSNTLSIAVTAHDDAIVERNINAYKSQALHECRRQALVTDAIPNSYMTGDQHGANRLLGSCSNMAEVNVVGASRYFYTGYGQMQCV